MHTDPFVTLAFFALVALVFLALGAVYLAHCERRDRRESRDWNRAMRRTTMTGGRS